MIIGAQGYTVREFAKDEAGIAETLRRVKEMGYNCFQMSAFGPIAPERVRELTDELGLSLVLTHCPPERILKDTDRLIREHEIMGCKNIGLGSMPNEYRGRGIAGVKEFVADYSAAVKRIGEAGLKFHYHNHAFEFERENGKTLIEWMADETDPVSWGFTADVYWAQFGGMNAARMFKMLKGRVDICHFKDFALVHKDGKDEQRMAPVMEGNLDWPAIMAACEEAGVQYALIEQDHTYGKDPFDELRVSYENLKRAGAQF
jgi:sugar phosphate isomerase/epimerase